MVHPENPGIAGVTIAQLSGPPLTPGAHLQNTVVVSTGTLDWTRPDIVDRRAGPLALRDRHLRENGGAARQGATRPQPGLRSRGHSGHYVHRPPAGGNAGGAIPRRGPPITGQAWITGFAQYVVDPEDPFPNGFTVGDIWGKHS